MKHAEDLERILRQCPGLMTVLETVRALDLPDPLVFSGAVFQPVLNHLTGRPLEQGIKDYDVGYFDAADLSYAAEDTVIRAVAAAFRPPLRERVEVRNQARVHLWFEDHFGEVYGPPLTHTAEALTRFVSPTCAVGVRLDPDGGLHIAAPFGLEDLFALRFRRNPALVRSGFAHVARGLQARWPELKVDGSEQNTV
jgi:uncharacterized protein